MHEVEAAQNTVTCQTGFDRPLLFGVNIPLSASASQRVKQVGGTVTRIGFNWDVMQPNRDETKLDYMDGLIATAQTQGLVMVGLISGTPQWASNNTSLPPYKAFPKKAELETYKSFVKQLVNSKKDKIKYWAFWNEPNGCGSSNSDCSYTNGAMDEYIYWLNATYDAVKETDSTAQVVGGELDYWRQVPDQVNYMTNHNAKFDILAIHPYDKDNNGIDFNGIKSAYERSGNKPVWLSEYGWGGNDTSDTREDAAKWIKQTLDTLSTNEYSFVKAAMYHEIFDYDNGDQGLTDKNPNNGEFRITGNAFREASLRICNPSFGTGTAGTTPPAAAGGNNITVRTYFAASAQTERPKIALYLNNAAGFISATSANDPAPNDTLPCDGSVAGPTSKCGGLNLYNEKLIEDFEVTTDTYVKDVVIPADKLVYLTGDGLGFTKLSYVFHNRNNNAIAVTKIEFYAPDGKLILTYAPQKGSQQYTVSPNQGTRALEKFYFDLGDVSNSSSDNYGMVRAFDKVSIQPKNDNDDYWTLSGEGSFNMVSVGVHKAIVNAFGGLNEPACVVASNDIGGLLLKRNIPVTLSAVANVPLKNTRFSFYNSDNRDPGNNNSPKAFCVQGAQSQAGDGCPTGSGQLVVDVKPSVSGTGAVQTTDWFLMPNGQALQSIWRGDIGWNRLLPYDPETFGTSSSISWNFSSYLTGINIGSFRPTAEIDAQDTYYGVVASRTVDKRLTMEIWRNNQMWTTTVGFVPIGSYVDWGTATPWTKAIDLSENSDDLPGNGQVTATGSFMIGTDRLWQLYWRGSEEWVRSVAYGADGKPNFAAANQLPNKGYTFNRNTSSLPGSPSKVQAISFMPMAGRRIQEQIWINNKLYKRTISQGPIDILSVDFAHASSYEGPLDYGAADSNQNASALVAYNTINQKDTLTNKMPVHLQVNATFTTANDKQIGNQGACVTWFTIDKSIEGDVNGDCVNDIYDYNVLLENYETENCQYNIAGPNGCRIDTYDVDYLKSKFGQSCPLMY